MKQFPNETEYSAGVKQTSEFERATRLYNFWLRARVDHHVAKSILPIEVIKMSLALNTKATRQFRAIVELCERGDGSSAQTISRSLFETLVATTFVLTPNVRLSAVKITDGAGNARLDHSGRIRYRVDVPEKVNKRRTPSLSRSQRATLVACAHMLQDIRFSIRHGNKNRYKRLSRMVAQRNPPNLVAQCDAAIGPEWTTIILETGEYSGLSLSKLVSVLGQNLDYYYTTLYHFHSRSVHVADALGNLAYTDDSVLRRSWYSPIGELTGVLEVATRLFVGMLHLVDEHIGLGISVRTVLYFLSKEMDAKYD